jgi:Tol biopolymer transport system component
MIGVRRRPTGSAIVVLIAAAFAAAALASARAGPAAAADSPPFDLVFEWTVNGNQDLYVVAGAGGPPRRLTTDPHVDALPRWSADGATIFFTSDRAGNWQVYRVAAGGGPAQRVRTNPHREWQAEPSPDGRALALLSNQDGPESLYVMDLASGAERMLVRHGRRTGLGNPSWSRDSRRLVFSTNWAKGFGIHIVEVATAEERPLTRVHPTGCEPRFHPDGRRVVYVRRGGQGDKSQLVEHDLETGRERTLVGWPALNYNPAYAPDGSEIAFTSNITGEWVVYRQRLSDGRAWRVTHGGGPARGPDYRPRRH